MSVRNNSCPFILCLSAGLFIAAALGGCGGGPYESAPVNAKLARETLDQVLTNWKKGESLDTLQNASPKIVVQDLDWSSGAKLIEYEIVGDGKEVDANLIAEVKLKLRDPRGKEFERNVKYVVGTSPVLTVFRDMF
jgi:hypothetical protein